MIQLLIIKTGNTYPEIASRWGDFEDWFRQALRRPGVAITVCDVAAGEMPPAVDSPDAVVVTGSPAMVTEHAAWSDAAADWLRSWVTSGKPVLGVCYGHQLLAHALGGEVGFHPDGREMGTLEVRLTGNAGGDALFGDYPAAFPAHLTHRQSVLRLPPESVLLAASDLEPHQAFRVGACAWGVQFHPEFDEPVMRAYLEKLAPALREEGRDPEGLLAAVQPTPRARQVLDRFVEYVMRGSWSGS